MRYYALKLYEDNVIMQVFDTFEKQDNVIQLSREEYEKAQLYNTFNPVTREFSNPKTIPDLEPTLEEQLQQMQAGMAQIAMQTAINTLLQGGI